MNYSGRYLSIGAAALGLVLSGPYSETAPLKAAPRPDRFYRESVLKQAVNKTESDILEFAAAHGFTPSGLIRSPLRGPAGNVEFLAWLIYPGDSAGQDKISGMISSLFQ